jgi:hypothetical protein
MSNASERRAAERAAERAAHARHKARGVHAPVLSGMVTRQLPAPVPAPAPAGTVAPAAIASQLAREYTIACAVESDHRHAIARHDLYGSGAPMAPTPQTAIDAASRAHARCYVAWTPIREITSQTARDRAIAAYADPGERLRSEDGRTALADLTSAEIAQASVETTLLTLAAQALPHALASDPLPDTLARAGAIALARLTRAQRGVTIARTQVRVIAQDGTPRSSPPIKRGGEIESGRQMIGRTVRDERARSHADRMLEACEIIGEALRFLAR